MCWWSLLYVRCRYSFWLRIFSCGKSARTQLKSVTKRAAGSLSSVSEGFNNERTNETSELTRRGRIRRRREMMLRQWLIRMICFPSMRGAWTKSAPTQTNQPLLLLLWQRFSSTGFPLKPNQVKLFIPTQRLWVVFGVKFCVVARTLFSKPTQWSV